MAVTPEGCLKRGEDGRASLLRNIQQPLAEESGQNFGGTYGPVRARIICRLFFQTTNARLSPMGVCVCVCVCFRNSKSAVKTLILRRRLFSLDLVFVRVLFAHLSDTGIS